jgi:hypothetical protein
MNVATFAVASAIGYLAAGVLITPYTYRRRYQSAYREIPWQAIVFWPWQVRP